MSGPAPTVTVIGAGLGGLTMAAVLHRHGVPVAVHDRDSGPHARPQGGMLDMHEDTGQAALRAAGLHAEFCRKLLPGGEAARVFDQHGTLLLDQPDTGTGGRPEIHRETLRTLLLDALPAAAVRWDSRLTSVQALDGGRHRLAFADGHRADTDLLVGADGAWSTVRPLLSQARPEYTGVTFAITRLHDVERRHPGPAAVVGGGMLFALGAGRALLAHREPGGTIELYVALAADPDRLADLPADRDAAGRALLAEFDGWHPDLRALITESDEPFVRRQVHALPVGHRWPRTAGVTLLGDAAHLMSPFAGEGANLAMCDGAELAGQLLAHGTGSPAAVETALAHYEQRAFPRAAAAAADSAASLSLMFGPDAAPRLRSLLTAVSAAPR